MAPIQTPYMRSTEFKDFYSNNARMAASPFDFTMMFGRMTEIGTGINALEDLVHVRLSPYHFKSFVQNMVYALDAWQKVFGDINETAPNPTTKEMILAAMQSMKEAVERAAQAGAPPVINNAPD